MRARFDALLALFLPLLWLHGVLALGIGLLVDLLATPWVWIQRRRTASADREPAQGISRNASLVVLNWNGRHFLEELMPSLAVAVARCPGDHEVIVVDNGSDDGSAQWLAEHHSFAQVVRLPENRFFIRGNRAGAEVATRDILVFINNDMRVEPDFLVALLAPFGAPDLFAVTGRIELRGARVETGCTRGFLKHGALRLEQVEAPAHGVPVLWAGGGSSAFDRRRYLELGGFEDLYEPCYVEDVSLCWQAWRRGWRVVFEPGAIVHHRFRGTSERVFGRAHVDRLDRRNRELFFHRGFTNLRWRLAHALFQPWNAWKDARTTGLRVQFGALLRSWPRLPAAWWARQRLRVHSRRSDQQALLASGGVLEGWTERTWRGG